MAQGVGNLNVSVTADTRRARANVDGFRKDVSRLSPAAKEAQRGLSGLSRGVGDLGRRFGGLLGIGVGIGGVGYAIKRQFSEVDRLAKTSTKLGIATERLEGLRLAASESGVEVNKLEAGLQRMVRRVAEAAQGAGEARGAVAELGLDAKRLNELKPDEMFRTIADAMSRTRNQSDRVRIAFKLFDSEGVDLVNTLALGRDGLNEVQKAAEDLGLAISSKDAKRIEQANDAIGRMKGGLAGLAREAAVFVAPAVEHVALAWANNFRALHGGLDAVRTIDQQRAATERLASATNQLQRAEEKQIQTAKRHADVLRDKQRAFDLELKALERRVAVAREGENETRLKELRAGGLNIAGQQQFVDATRAAERAETIADQTTALKDLAETIRDFGKSPLVAERDRFVRNAATPELAQQGRELYGQLITLDRIEEFKRDLPGMLGKAGDFLNGVFGVAPADRRRLDPLDANSAEGYSALRANVPHSQAEQQLKEQQVANNWLERIFDKIGEQDFGDVFSLNG